MPADKKTEERTFNEADLRGALFDFCGYLTTRAETIPVGEGADAMMAFARLTTFFEVRGLEDAEANVLHWNETVARAEAVPAAAEETDPYFVLDFCEGAIKDAIMMEGGLSREAGQAVLTMIANARAARPESSDVREWEIEERLAERVLSTSPLDPNDGDTESADAADWIIAAVRAALTRQEEALIARAEVSERNLKMLSERLNAPELHDFVNGVVLEAAHQRERWGSDHDAGKAPADWFWLIGYLAGKALAAHLAGNVEKALHHTISTAAALNNWHAAILGLGTMRPGLSAAAHEEIESLDRKQSAGQEER